MHRLGPKRYEKASTEFLIEESLLVENSEANIQLNVKTTDKNERKSHSWNN